MFRSLLMLMSCFNLFLSLLNLNPCIIYVYTLQYHPFLFLLYYLLGRFHAKVLQESKFSHTFFYILLLTFSLITSGQFPSWHPIPFPVSSAGANVNFDRDYSQSSLRAC